MKLLLGHDGPPTMYRENLITGEPFARCPVREMLLADPVVVREVDRMRLEYYPLFKRGHLLVTGGVADQPALYLDYMTRIAQLERVVDAKLNAPEPGDGEG